MHPELVRAIVTACLAKTPNGARRQLASKDEAKRIKAEDTLTAMIVVALAEVKQPARIGNQMAGSWGDP